MLADCASDLGPSPSLVLQLRWRVAIVVALLCFTPRAAFGNLSRPFVIDVTGRAIAFGALALALQVLFGTRSDVAAWSPSLMTTIPFVVIPVIWRLRLEPIPIHQQRLLTAAFTATCMIAALMSAPEWPVRAAAMISFVWLGLSGWRIADCHMRQPAWLPTPWPPTPWWAIFYPVWAIIVSSWPIKIALGIGLFNPWWPGDNLIAYIVGVLITLSVWDRVQRQIATP